MRKRGLCCRYVSVRPSQLVDCIQTAVRKMHHFLRYSTSKMLWSWKMG